MEYQFSSYTKLKNQKIPRNVWFNGNGMRYRCKCTENDVTSWMISNLMR